MLGDYFYQFGLAPRILCVFLLMNKGGKGGSGGYIFACGSIKIRTFHLHSSLDEK